MIAEEKQGGFALDLGRHHLDELFSLGEDGFAARKSSASSSTALLFEAADHDKTMLVSNVTDGWDTLCNAIAIRTKTDLYKFAWSNADHPDAMNAFRYTDFSAGDVSAAFRAQRVVYAMKDPRWIFYETGKPLPFEDVSLYKKRKITDRMNKPIIISYCGRLGIDVTAPDFLDPQGMVLRLDHTW